MLHSAPLSQLPKNVLKVPAHDPLDTSSAAAYAALSNPSPSATLRQPDQRFLDSESFTNRFASHVSHNMERVSRRMMKRWSGTFTVQELLARYGTNAFGRQSTRMITLSWERHSMGSVCRNKGTWQQRSKSQVKPSTQHTSLALASYVPLSLLSTHSPFI